MEKVLYKEEQRFNQWWLWLILIFSFAAGVLPIWYGLYQQLHSGKPWGDNPSSNAVLLVIAIFTTLLMSGILLLFRASRLLIEISNDGIHFRFPPFIRKWRTISKDEIEKFTVGKYNPIKEYGGYGVKKSYGKYGNAYNVSGNFGLRLYLKNGKVLLLGTQRTQAISFAMQKLMSDKELGK